MAGDDRGVPKGWEKVALGGIFSMGPAFPAESPPIQAKYC